MDGSLPGSSVHGILQAGILEWVAMPSSKGSSQPRDRSEVSISPALAAALPCAILTFVNTPYKRGFYCGDDSIRYPYRPDTITHGLMAGVIITATVILVSAGEAYLVYTDRLYSRSDFNNYLAALYKVVGTFLFGAAVSQSLTDLAKYMTGRLRPNFLAVCDPDWSRVNCSAYVQVEVCRGSSANVTESRLSFYSGHSSFGMYCMVFLAVRYISDFFKARPPQHCPEEEDLERKPSLSLTLALGETDCNHYGYPVSSS
ncbi:phospholipid phosphatase 2 isoform X2 [Bos javanicus]|uniref:phospholipid phosphatase 2 isoform X1 n=1 Tax=Bos taurus TaxID=9913 RepID=UPI0028CB8C93|nr:phospholipid phosphatase 2 isoform X1 [Bos taurus]XP_061279218.1 phospholipid phosphatase 2 isoform X2 [Bos javanicus]